MMSAVRLYEVSWELVPREARLLLCRTPAGFPSSAQDDMEEPIDLGAWLVEQPAASYVMRVDGHSMKGAGINDGDLVVVSRAAKPRAGSIVVALIHGDRALKRLRKLDGRLGLLPEAKGTPTRSSTRRGLGRGGGARPRLPMTSPICPAGRQRLLSWV